MHIKAQTVIPAGTKITKCPPREANGKSVWALERAQERKLARDTELKVKAEKVAELIKNGMSVPEALKLLSE